MHTVVIKNHDLCSYHTLYLLLNKLYIFATVYSMLQPSFTVEHSGKFSE